MAACPPKEADEKVPDKLRSNCSLINQPFERNVDGNGENKTHGCEMSKKVHQDEVSAAKENGDELQKLSDDEFKNLLQEACCLSSNPNSGNHSKLLRNLISETDIKDPECSQNFTKTWSYRKEGRKHSDRRARLDSYNHGVGNSAASCTTQGGSLQNLHGKPESKKLQKTGSLITFPAATAVSSETTRELAQVKAYLAENPLKLTATFTKCKPQSSSVVAAPLVSTASEYPVTLKSKIHRTWSEYHCDASDSASLTSASASPKDSSLKHNHFRKCHSVDTHPKLENVHDNKKDVQGLKVNLSKFTSKSLDGDEQRNGESAAVEMMDIDCNNDEPENESSPLLKDSTNCNFQGVVHSSVRPYGSIDLPKIKIGSAPHDVDTSISIPLMLKTHAGDLATAHTENWSSGNCVRENYGIYRLSSSDSVSVTGFMGSPANELRTGESNQDKRKKELKTENEDGKSTISFRSLDENGNPLILCTSETNSKTVDLMTTMNPVVLSHTMDRDGGTDGNIQKRKPKKTKFNSRQKDIRPEEIEGYFGALEVEDILKRFNSLENLDDSKKKGSKECYKQHGTKGKKVLSNRDVSKKNMENDIGQMNGTKDGFITRNKVDNDIAPNSRITGSNLNGPKKSFNHISDYDLSVNKLVKQITPEISSSNCVTSTSFCEKAGDNGSLSIYSHLLKPSADVHFAVVTDAKVLPLTCIVDIKETRVMSGCPPSDERVNHFDPQAVKNNAGGLNQSAPLSSFVEDFYANPDVPSILEDSEFHEVKKKKKKKPRSGLSFKNDTVTHYRYYCYNSANSSSSSSGPGASNMYSVATGSGAGNVDGRRETPSAWNDLRPLSHHRNQRSCSEDVRRKSTSSVPPSEHSSADNSDVESVHSLPVSSTTPRPVINKTSSSSSCTPQASYADIAKMSTSVSAPSGRSGCPFKVGISYQHSQQHSGTLPLVSTATAAAAIVLVEMKRDASTATDDCLSYCDAAALPSQIEECDKKPEQTLIETVSYSCNPSEKVILVNDLEVSECATNNQPQILSSCNPNCDQDKDSVLHRASSGASSSSGHVPSLVSENSQQNNVQEEQHDEPQDTSDSAISTTVTAGSVEDNSLLTSADEQKFETDSCSIVTAPSSHESEEVVVSSDLLFASQSYSSTRSYPGVIFIGAMDVCEELPGVTFGFEVNEELLRMTSVEMAGLHQMMVPDVTRTEESAPNVVLGSEDDQNKLNFTLGSDPNTVPLCVNQEEELVVFSPLDSVPVASTPDVSAAVDATETQSRPSDSFVDEISSVNYLNIVDYIGNAWDGVQEELKKESSSGSSNWPSKVQYYKP